MLYWFYHFAYSISLLLKVNILKNVNVLSNNVLSDQRIWKFEELKKKRKGDRLIIIIIIVK